MKEESKKDLLFILYIAVILLLAVIYFSVPERALFRSEEHTSELQSH